MNADQDKLICGAGATSPICVDPRSSAAQPLPLPRVAIATRVATMDDLPFLDALQKQHSKALGFFPRAQMEGYVDNQWVLIAEPSTEYSVPSTEEAKPLGYVISRDRYLKRDELGVVYQLCVVPGNQRKLIGAALIQSVFERSAYGCKLYCCWCAQDLAANHFWESMGFVPIAFRAGSTGKRRVHIFWQRRINADDVVTPYWYPCQTNGGAIRADRLVFPIPPGTHWAEVQAVALPNAETPRIASEAVPRVAPRKRKPAPIAKPANVPLGGFQFQAEQPAPAVKAKPRRAAEKTTVKVDPKLVAAARELRDRYLERVNADERFVLPATTGKYRVGRSLPPMTNASALPLLKAG
jgi:hypothetical protein